MALGVDQEYDPFAGILDRSTVAQALKEARASLARPTRPVTGECRSLFQHANDSNSSRPSSSYSIDQLSFVQDTFNTTSDSLRSTGSKRSHGSKRYNPIPEYDDEDPPLEAPEPQLCDLIGFDDSGNICSEWHSKPSCGIRLKKSSTAPADDAEMPPDEEYDASAADDLAMRMDVPPPGSDEELTEDEIQTPSNSKRKISRPSSASKIGAVPPSPSALDSAGKPKRRSSSRTSLNGPHRSSSSGGLQDQPSGQSGWTSRFHKVLADIDTVNHSPSGGQVGENMDSESMLQLADRIHDLVAEVPNREHKKNVKQAPKLLHAVLSLMDKRVDALCLLRLARAVLELINIKSARQDVSIDGASAAYLNVAKALFKLSKDASNDGIFREEGLLSLLLTTLDPADAACNLADFRVFVVGTLKNTTNNDDNQRYLMKHNALPTLMKLTKPANLLHDDKDVQLLIQITALVRNLVVSSRRQQQFVEIGAVDDIVRISAMYETNEELQVNIARILSKVTSHDASCEAYTPNATHVRQMVSALRTHAGSAPLVVRLSYVLGNLAAKSTDIREIFMSECNGVMLLSELFQRYWRQDRKLAQAEAVSGQKTQGTDASDTEAVLVKLVRLIANVTISCSTGIQVASSGLIIDPLLDLLGCKKISVSEELVLNSVAAVTNLLYFDAPASLLFTPENKQLLCRLLRPMLLESYNVEALVESARALGNISRHADARQWMAELRIDEVLSILLAHDDRDLVFYSCGALVNLASDGEAGRRLCRVCGLRSKLASVLQEAPSDDPELCLVAVKALSNLRIHGGSEEAPWSAGELESVREGVQRACEVGQAMLASSEDQGPLGLPQLAERLLESLPPSAVEPLDMAAPAHLEAAVVTAAA